MPRTICWRRTPLYGNCYICAPDGQRLCRTTRKRIQWYLDRGLAELREEDTIYLKKEPSGRCKARFLLSYKENKCVVCGNPDKNSRHHIVPKCFRTFYPHHLKSGVMDVVLLCIECHHKYEDYADELKIEIAKEFGINLQGRGWYIDKSIYKVSPYAKSLKRYGSKMPPDRREKLLGALREYYGKYDITDGDIEAATRLKPFVKEPQYKTYGQFVVEHLQGEDALKSFAYRWRQHFVSVMTPQFLPVGWDIYGDL